MSFFDLLLTGYSSIAFCVCWQRNMWNGQNFPFLSQSLFYLNGTRYKQLNILDENFMLDPAKLEVEVGFEIFQFQQRF
jgi:hypothetical protein